MIVGEKNTRIQKKFIEIWPVVERGAFGLGDLKREQVAAHVFFQLDFCGRLLFDCRIVGGCLAVITWIP